MSNLEKRKYKVAKLEIKIRENLIRKKVKKIQNSRIMIPTTISLAPKTAKRNSRIKHKICSKLAQTMVLIRLSLSRLEKARIQTSLP